MKNFNLNFLFLLLVAISFQSCTKDLDVISKDPTILSDDILYSSANGYEKGLAGVYGNFSLTGTGGPTSSFLQGIDPGTSQFGRCLWYLQNLTTDEAIWTYENDGGIADLQRNIWTASNPILLGMFSRTMASVALCNEFLRQSSPEKLSARNISGTEAAKIEIYRNEVRALRAYAYYNMMDLYGKAPILDENSAVNVEGQQSLRPQLFSFVESELTAVLPNLLPARSNVYGRLDKGFAWAVLAKIYLNSEVYIGTAKYAECQTMCSNIIGAGYTLNPTYLNNFKADNNLSNEMIFTLQSDANFSQNYGATTVMINGQVGSVEANGATLYGVNGWGGALRLRKEFTDKFNNSIFNNDTRNTIFKGGRSAVITNVTDAGQGFILGKYSNFTSTGALNSNGAFVDTDFPLFRLADFYLMAVEAQMRKDGATNTNSIANANATSVGYINALRTRAFNGATTGNVTAAQITPSFLIDERSRELHWEGHRRQDLIRFGLFSGSTYVWAWKANNPTGSDLDAHFNVFPIPGPSMDSNRNLTQNQGY